MSASLFGRELSREIPTLPNSFPNSLPSSCYSSRHCSGARRLDQLFAVVGNDQPLEHEVGFPCHQPMISASRDPRTTYSMCFSLSLSFAAVFGVSTAALGSKLTRVQSRAFFCQANTLASNLSLTDPCISARGGLLKAAPADALVPVTNLPKATQHDRAAHAVALCTRGYQWLITSCFLVRLRRKNECGLQGAARCRTRPCGADPTSVVSNTGVTSK